MSKKVVAVALLVLMSLAVSFTPIAMVVGQNSLGIGIIRVLPASEANTVLPTQSVYTGSVGDAFNLQGTIYTSNGAFKIIFGNIVVASGTSQGYLVNSNFTVPQLTANGYNLILEDVGAGNVNSTGSTPETFTITTTYNINPINPYIQEGNSEALNVSITGGSASASYVANISVTIPSPLNANYSTTLTLNTNQVGTAITQVSFPNVFQSNSSVSASTEYAGLYEAFFNQSQGLAFTAFSVGFLDSVTYHRGDPVKVSAIGYQSGQSATISITSVATGTSLYSQPITASSDGVITLPTPFQVPSTAAIENYTVAIAATGNQKSIADSQVFTVPGYPVKIKTVNLAGAAVTSVAVKAEDSVTSTVYTGTSASDGIASLNLEAGTYALTATWKSVGVGSGTITVSANALSFSLACQLTNLVIVVKNENGTTLPFVNLQISYSFGSSQTGTVSAQTGPSGSYTLNSTLVTASYTVKASLYGQVFNSGNDTVSSLPSQGVSQVVIICPSESLTLSVVGYNGAAISGARVKLIEATNGLFYTAASDSSGSATFPVTFGKYKVQIYENNIIINETTVQAFSNRQYQIRCTLYGIKVSVSVVDYFGSPIFNANVTINGPASERFSTMTHGDGTAAFDNIIGGNLQIVAFASGAESNYQSVTLTVSGPTSVQIRMDKYIALGAFLMPTSAVLAIIIILVALILLVTIEVYRRKRHRSTET